MYDPTVARLTYRGLLGRRRALILGALPVLLIVISVVVRALTGRGLPQLLVRIGATPSDEPIPPPTPRRPLTDVLTIRR